jgi:hypothetical protein
MVDWIEVHRPAALAMAGVLLLLATAPGTARGAAAGSPQLGRTMLVRAVGGVVFVKRRRDRRAHRLRRTATIPVGSTIDATRGRVRLISATRRRGVTQSGVFSEGAFVAGQGRSSALTDLTLTGGGLSRCRGQGATASRSPRRRLAGNAHGSYRTKGGYSAGTLRGTVWLMEDTCKATTTTVRRGEALVTSQGDLRISVHVRRDSTLSMFCTKHGPTVAPIYCLQALTTPRLRGVGFGIATASPPEISSYDFCIAGPGFAQCGSFPLAAPTPLPGHNPLRSGVFVCLPASAGVFTGTWRVGGTLVGTLSSARAPGGGSGECQAA